MENLSSSSTFHDLLSKALVFRSICRVCPCLLRLVVWMGATMTTEVPQSESNHDFVFINPQQKEKKCSPTQKAPKPIHLFYGECASVRLYRPTYCGVCKNGRCCSPRHSRTVPVTFVCQDGERLQKSVMFIQSCKCSEDCEHLNDVALPSQHWMYGDTHKFID